MSVRVRREWGVHGEVMGHDSVDGLVREFDEDGERLRPFMGRCQVIHDQVGNTSLPK